MANIAKIKRLSIDNIAKIYKINKNSIAKVMGIDLAAPNTRDVYIDYHNIDSDLTNFPLLINLSNSSGKDNYDITEIFDTIGSDYSKLKVYDSNGTQLYTEVEQWDATNKTAQLWVKVPHISSSVYTHLILDYNSDSGSNDYISDNPAAKPINLSVDIRSQGTYDTKDAEECSIIKDGNIYKMWYSGYDGTINPFHYRIIYCDSTDGINWSNFQMVINYNTEGTYDATRAYRPCVIKDGSTYKMWYSGSDESHFRIIYCTSTDGINWSNFQMVVDKGSEGTYDTTDVTDPYVIKDGNIYKMWYTGYAGSPRRIIYCTSTDGINWSNFQMVVDINSEGTHDTTRAAAPRVIKESDTSYKMWYTGWYSSGGSASIIYCTSTDGISWSNFQLVVDKGSEGTYDSKSSRYSLVIKESDNLYKMWYDGWHAVTDGNEVRILYTTSEDGINWYKNVVNRVWDDDFVAVYHMNQDPSGTAYNIYDSTSNAHHGKPHGNMTSGDLVNGQIDGALEFDGIDDYIGINYTSNFYPSNWSFGLWIKRLADSGAYERLLSYCSSTAYDKWIQINTDDSVQFGYVDTSGAARSIKTTETVPLNTWEYLTGTFNGSYLKTYINGTLKAINNFSSYTPRNSNYPVQIGRLKNDYHFNGIIDEVRISKTAKSAEWVKATYYSNLDNLIAYDKEVYTLEIDNSNIDSNLTNFPLLVNLSNSAGVNNYDLTKIFDTIGSDYTKLRIYDSNGQQLYTEVENWDATNKTAQLWVKVPVVSGTSTTKLTLDYGATYGNVDYISDNPVAKAINLNVDFGSEGTYDTGGVYSPCVIKESDTSYKMWYTGNATIIYCDSTDGINWTNFQRVVSPNSEGTYDTYNAYNPSVIKDGSTYKMWYGGNDGTNARIIYCTSTDGINWSNFQMVVDINTEGTYDVSGANEPCVIKDGSTYKMWYSGYDGTSHRVMYATSTNGTLWSNHQMVVDKGSESTYDTNWAYQPLVIKDGNTYKMWYSGNGGYINIIYCTSTNGTSWSNFQQVVDKGSEGTYDSAHTFKTYVIKEDTNLYKMWYSGSDGTNYRILYATSEDGKVWTKNVVNRVWDDDFVGIWHMNQDPTSSGTIYDSTLNAIHGISSDNMDSNNLVDGEIGKALEFDGANDGVDLGNPTSLQITGDQTISMWLKPASLNTSRNPYAKAYGGEGTITQFTDGTVKYYYGTAGTNGTPYQEFSMLNALVVGEWSHLAIVRDLTNMKLRWYKNGILTSQADALYDHAVASNLHAYIGKGYVPDCYDGVIDDLRVYDRALKESEVAQLAGIDLTNGLVGYWKFDEGSGTTAVDSSGHSGDGTLLNGPTWVDGVSGKALSFDGTDDYVLINSPSSHVNDNIITITSWFKGLGGIVGTDKYLIKSMTNEIQVWYDVGTNQQYFTVTYNSSKWHFITVELNYNNNTTKVWLDGDYVGEQSHPGTSLTVSDLRIGSFNQTMHFFNGAIDDVHIYNRELSEFEIIKLSKNTEPNYGLVGYWKFDEGTGTTTGDSSGNGNDGTLVNGPTWVDGISGKALGFDGVDDYVSVPGAIGAQSLNFGTGDFTISAWVKTSTTADYRKLIQKGASAGFSGWRFGIGNGYLHCLIGDPVDYLEFQLGSTSIADGLWHNLTVVFDRSSYATGYVDGQYQGQVDISTVSGSVDNAYDVTMGYSFAYYNGLIDEVRMYNRALTGAEISQLTDMGVAIGLVGHWKFDEGTGTTASDSSGNGNTMSIHGTVSWITGVYGKALDFGASNSDYAEVTSPTGLSSNYVSVSCWVNVNAMENYNFIVRHNWANASGAWTLYTDTTQIGFGVYSGSALYISNYTTDISNEWHHLTGVYDGSFVRLYLDGEAVGTSVALSGQVLDTTSNIGISFDQFAKKVDDLRIYNRALTSQDVKALYNGLVGHWKFDEGTGTTAGDSSGNGNDGTLINGPTWSDGISGKALSFDGVDDYVEVPNSSGLNPSTITVAYWAKSTTTGWSDYSCHVSKRNAYIMHPLLGMTRMRFYIYDGAWYSAYYDVSDITIWHHYAGTYDGNTIKLYVDGNLSASFPHVGSINTLDTGSIFIGKDDGTEQYYNGLLDDIRIYNRPLSAEEVSQLSALGLTNGLVGYWKFDEGFGTTTIDSSGNGNDGTLVNNPTWVDGVSGKALSFDGVDDYVDITDDSILSGFTDFTISVWLYPQSTTNDYQALIVKNPNTGTRAYEIYFRNTGQITTYLNGNGIILNSVTSLSLNTWNHYIITRDGSNITVYINGTVDYSTDQYGVKLATNTTPLRIGYNGVGLSAFYGIIDDVRIYNRALSAAEVSQLTDMGVANGLVGYWKFDEGSGTTVSDSSGNGNNGTFINNPTWVDGVKGKALSFNGVGDYIKTASQVDLSGSELTITAFFKGSLPQSIIRQQSSGYIVFDWWGKDILSNDGGTSGGVSTGNLVDGSWHYVAMTWKQNTTNGFNAYKDGQVVDQKNSSNTPIPNLNDSIYFGSFGGNSEFVVGTIDEIRISKISRSADWIKATYYSNTDRLNYWNN